MAVRSRTLAKGTIVGASTTSAYTVPANRTLIVKRCRIYVTVSAAANLRVEWWDGTTDVIVFLAATPAVGVQPLADIVGDVLEEGHVIRIGVGAGITVKYWLSGALLLGDPA